MRDSFSGQGTWERDIERSPIRYIGNQCLNCGYRSRPSMSQDVCSACIFKQGVKYDGMKSND